MIMHPYKSELDGKDLRDFKDPQGKRLFVEMASVSQAHGGGFVDYLWPKHDAVEPVPKVSYVKLFKPWNWIIGSGVYTDDVALEIKQIRYGSLLWMGLGALLAIAVSVFNAIRQLKNVVIPLQEMSGKLKE